MQELADLNKQSQQPFAVQGAVLGISDDGLFAQVRIPTYHTDIGDDLLPWYIVMQPNSVTGHNVDGLAKVYSALGVGTRVLVALLDANGTSGAVLGVVPNKSNAARPNDVVHGWEDNIGNSLMFTKDGTINFKAKSGLTVTITSDGDLSINGRTIEVNALTLNTEALDSTFTATNMTVQGEVVTIAGDFVDILTGAGAVGVPPTLTPRTLPSEPDITNKKDW